jgi:hypothetical protein
MRSQTGGSDCQTALAKFFQDFDLLGKAERRQLFPQLWLTHLFPSNTYFRIAATSE